MYSFNASRGAVELSHAYQPIIDTHNNSVFAFEVLLRGPSGNAPIDLLRKLRDDELEPFDHFSRSKAIERFVDSLPNQRLSLNFTIDALTKNRGYYFNRLLRSLEEYKVDPSQIIIEITEGDVIHGVYGLKEAVKRIRESGAKVAIDDFGSGYAGLNALAEVNPDILKIDQYLIRDINTVGIKRTLVNAVQGVCLDMGIDLIAEGVETEQELNTLNNIGITLIQGFYTAKPLNIEQVIEQYS
jgi:EAL domain-containing protein (putative c-di-GMP-specific phosphodiesterase class I)